MAFVGIDQVVYVQREGQKAIVLGKGPVSHVATPDGRSWTYSGGVPGLGIAGSGDTLAGIVGALVAVPLIAVVNTAVRRLARRGPPAVPPDAVVVASDNP